MQHTSGARRTFTGKAGATVTAATISTTHRHLQPDVTQKVLNTARKRSRAKHFQTGYKSARALDRL